MTAVPSRLHAAAALAAVFTLAALAALTGCGGGSDGGVNNTVAGVTSASAATPRYRQDLIITLQGRNLDKPITPFVGGSVVTPSCGSLALSTTAPYISSATTAYYRCTAPALGAQSVTFVRPSDQVVLAQVPFTVPLPQVTFTISNGAGVSGNLVLALEPAKAPITVNNFLAYVNSGFYVDTVFHRLVPGFIIQGGGYAKTLVPNTTPQPTLKPPSYAPIQLEDVGTGLTNVRLTIAMARTNDPNSATSQFFINLADNPGLNGSASSYGYAVFGNVTAASAALVTAMAAAPCASWPDFFAGDAASACLPNPNLVITAAVQTQ